MRYVEIHFIDRINVPSAFSYSECKHILYSIFNKTIDLPGLERIEINTV